MTLLTQTASPTNLIYAPATASLMPAITSTAQIGPPGPINGGTAQIGATGWSDTSVERKRVQPPTYQFYSVWQVTSGWIVNMNLVIGFSPLVNPPVASKRVSGVFQDQNGSPIARTGFLFDRSTGAFLCTFASSAVDGSWNGYVPTTNPVFAVLIPSGADSRNGVMMDNLTPI